jgi:hypothetical protein
MLPVHAPEMPLSQGQPQVQANLLYQGLEPYQMAALSDYGSPVYAEPYSVQAASSLAKCPVHRQLRCLGSSFSSCCLLPGHSHA